MTTRYDWPFYRPITLDGQALQVLEKWRAALPKDKLPDAEFGPPEWAFSEAAPVWAYLVRRCTCYVFLFQQRQNGASGFVLNADWNRAQPIRGDSVQALSAALSIATIRPAAHGRKEV
jgi:hypothetical protein